jgi:hypothetical protein
MKMEGSKSENAAGLNSKETLINRYKLKPIWRLFMIVNLGLGGSKIPILVLLGFDFLFTMCLLY